ncbi:MAG: SpoVA/SpoVAEb family sporulation membrane protein [Bacilli bacterium]|nr:SpoVA/SpoVAEb family sporulation membrane protein [Bacilli bacterium]
MDKEKYQKIVDKNCPKENVGINAVKSFLVGGFMGILGQLLLDIYTTLLDIPTKEASTYMIITLIFVGSLFTALGFFDKWVSWANCGLIVPITGFAHAMTSAAIEYRKEGFVLGLGANIFKLTGSVILYGVVSAYFFGLIRVLLFGG